MKALILATAMAVGFASYASAAEVKKATTVPAPVVKAQKMTDADMDKVTAAGVPDFTGQGLLTADSAGVIGIIGQVSRTSRFSKHTGRAPPTASVPATSLNTTENFTGAVLRGGPLLLGFVLSRAPSGPRLAALVPFA